MEPTTKKWKTEKLKNEKRICSEVSVNKKRKATVGRACRKERL